MGRRRKQGTAEDIMALVARLPWWAGIVLAGLSYAIFHSLAVRPQPVVSDAAQIGSLFPHIFVSGISYAMQYLLPPLCLVGAGISFFRGRARGDLVANVTASSSADALNSISWRDFELLVGEAFRLQGYEVQEQGGAQPDGGVDLVLKRGRETFLVQCKQWRAMKVGVDVVRELYGVMAARGAAGGFVVTSGRFTDDATAFAAGRNLRLVDGQKLFGLIQQAKTSFAAQAAVPATSQQPVREADGSQTTPACPNCSATMVLRTARKGTTAGSQFWGCSRFPACRGTR